MRDIISEKSKNTPRSIIRQFVGMSYAYDNVISFGFGQPDFVTPLQAALLEVDVQFGNAPCHIPIREGHALVIGERSAVPVHLETLLEQLVD